MNKTDDIRFRHFYDLKYKLAQKLQANHTECSQVCSCYDSECKSCKLFGNEGLSPSRCNNYLNSVVSMQFKVDLARGLLG